MNNIVYILVQSNCEWGGNNYQELTWERDIINLLRRSYIFSCTAKLSPKKGKTSVERLHLICYNNWPKISNDQIDYYALNLFVFCSLPMRLVLEQLWYHQQGNWLNRCVN